MIEETLLLGRNTPFENKTHSFRNGLKVRCETFQDGNRAGVQMVHLTDENFSVLICPTRGFGLWDIRLDGVSFCWNSPIDGPINPANVNLFRPDGLGWLEGFDEAMVRCGLRNVGPPQFDQQGRLVHPIHGNIANLAANIVTLQWDPSDPTVLRLIGVVDDTLFHFHRLRLTVEVVVDFKDQSIKVHDRAQNLGGRPADLCLMHHWNFGTPVFGKGSRIHSKISSIEARDDYSDQSTDRWNQVDAPGSASSESVYFFEPEATSDQGTIVLTDDGNQNAVRVRFPLETFPVWTLWKNPVSEADGFAIGLEPGTCYPDGVDAINKKGFMQVLPPGESFVTYSEVQCAKNNTERIRSWIKE